MLVVIYISFMIRDDVLRLSLKTSKFFHFSIFPVGTDIDSTTLSRAGRTRRRFVDIYPHF